MGFFGEGPFKTGASQGGRDFYRQTEKGQKAMQNRDKRAAKQAENDHYPTGLGCAFLALAMAGGVLAALAGAGWGVVQLVS